MNASGLVAVDQALGPGRQFDDARLGHIDQRQVAYCTSKGGNVPVENDRLLDIAGGVGRAGNSK